MSQQIRGQDSYLNFPICTKNTNMVEVVEIFLFVKLDLPYIYWIPKMHKNPYKHRFIAGSSKCSTKPLSILLTKLFIHIKQGLQKYC